jgi:hypothetical protein
MASVLHTSSGKAVRIRLAVRYIDGFTKCQSWDDDFIQQTQKLIFDPTELNAEERDKFGPHRDWRDNPCVVRYRADTDAIEFICQRGKTGAKKRRGLTDRGEPIGIEFRILSADGTFGEWTFDKDWLDNTTFIRFVPSRTEMTIFRRSRDGAEGPLLTEDGEPGELPFPIPGMTRDGLVDECLCGLPPFVRRTWN